MLDDRTTTFSWEDEANAKTEKALALTEQVVDWFRDNYEDPPASTPFCSQEGGYVYVCGGPYDAREELSGHFTADAGVSDDELDEIIDLAVEEIERDGLEWAKIRNDYGGMLLYAAPHQWGSGRVHWFNEETGKTVCGRTLENCPGTIDAGDADEVDCKSCLSKRRVQADKGKS